jgi:hypothetical protein
MKNLVETQEKIDNLTQIEFSYVIKKYLNKINLKQRQEFHLRFPNFELEKYSKIDCIKQSFYYYKFSSEVNSYEFEINKSDKNKYSFKFYVNDELEWCTQKITKKKIFVEDQLDIKTYFNGQNEKYQFDITNNDLHHIINWLFLHENFIYNI